MGKVFKQGFALIVGVGGKDDLPCTVNDANAIADILKHPQRCAYPASQVRVLTEDTARRTSILDALDQLAKKTKSDSTVVIYFSGHGYKVSSTFGDFYYLMPYRYDKSNLKDTAISGTEFIEKIKAIPAQKVLILLDCCHAGGFDNLKSPEIGGVFTNSPYPPETEQLLQEGTGRVLIASSRENEKSLTGQPLSQFTFALLEALCGEGASKKDGFVRVADLAVYTGRIVPGRTKNKQNPALNFEHADNFAVAYYAAGEKISKGLPNDYETMMPELEASEVPDNINIFGKITQGDEIHAEITNGDFFIGDKIIGVPYEELPSMFNSLRRSVEKMPDGNDKENMLLIFRTTQEFGKLHDSLHELKKIHDFLTKIITATDKFIPGIEEYKSLDSINREWKRVEKLITDYKKYYLVNIKIVDHYEILKKNQQEGGKWIVEVVNCYSDLDVELKRCDANSLNKSKKILGRLASSLHFHLMYYLEQVDSDLLTVANEIQSISKHISNIRNV